MGEIELSTANFYDLPTDSTIGIITKHRETHYVEMGQVIDADTFVSTDGKVFQKKDIYFMAFHKMPSLDSFAEVRDIDIDKKLNEMTRERYYERWK